MYALLILIETLKFQKTFNLKWNEIMTTGWKKKEFFQSSRQRDSKGTVQC